MPRFPEPYDKPDAAPVAPAAPAAEPSEGGSYVRNPDGSLSRVSNTEQPDGRRSNQSPKE